MDYCNVFISCLDSHSDGTHSLQRINWWASDVMLHFSKSVLMKKKAASFGWNISSNNGQSLNLKLKFDHKQHWYFRHSHFILYINGNDGWYLGPVCSTTSVWLTPPLVWGCPAHVCTTEEDWGEDEEKALLLETRTTWWHKNMVKTFQSVLLQTFIIIVLPEWSMNCIINLVPFELAQLIKRVWNCT